MSMNKPLLAKGCTKAHLLSFARSGEPDEVNSPPRNGFSLFSATACRILRHRLRGRDGAITPELPEEQPFGVQ